MGLVVNTNIAALNSYRNLSVTDGQMNKSLEKLSSGFRINRAADDAAGLAISEGLRSQIGGLKVAVRNTQDGISVVQTAEGALTETHSILQRMRNGKKLLDGSFSANFQVGANSGETIQVNIGTAMGSTGLGVSGVDVTAAGLYSAGTSAAAGKVNVSTAAGDASAAKLTITAAGTDTFATGTAAVTGYANLTGTISFGGKSFDLGSVDYGKAADTSNNGVTDGTESLAALNKAAKSALGLTTDPFASGSSTTITFQVQDAMTGYTEAGGVPAGTAAGTPTVQQNSAATPIFTAASGATTAIDLLDKAIKTVSTQRADLGAVQNRFDHTINNLNVAVENLTASESRIRDADMAQEMVGFTRNQILSQAGTAMLAQANQASQGVLSLLR
jgi:flagellin-like hook-associated protein FlgL